MRNLTPISRPRRPTRGWLGHLAVASLAVACSPTGDAEVVESERQRSARAREVSETAIRECMNQRGFQYVPDLEAPHPDDSAQVMDDAAFAENFGYAVSIDSVLTRSESSTAAPRPDPNEEYVSSLDPTARAAYWNALAEGPASCWDRATAVLVEHGYAPPGDPNIEVGIEELLMDFPEFIQALDAWSGCMSKKGYRFPHPGAAYEDVVRRFEQLPERESYEGLPMSGRYTREYVLQEEGPLGVYDPQELAELQAYERALAIEDSVCYDEEEIESTYQMLVERLQDQLQ